MACTAMRRFKIAGLNNSLSLYLTIGHSKKMTSISDNYFSHRGTRHWSDNVLSFAHPHTNQQLKFSANARKKNGHDSHTGQDFANLYVTQNILKSEVQKKALVVKDRRNAQTLLEDWNK
jgi:hypothetical protein